MSTFKSIAETVQYFLSKLNESPFDELLDSDSFRILDDLREKNLYRLYGDSILYKDRVILFCGHGGMGKTTMVHRFTQNANAIQFSENYTWTYLYENNKPVIFNNFYKKDDTDIIHAPLEWIVYLTYSEAEPEISRKVKKEVIDTIAESYLRDAKRILSLILYQLKFFKYNLVND